MLNFSLRFLGQTSKLLLRLGMVLGGVLLFSVFRLITYYLLSGPDNESTDPGLTIDDAYNAGLVGEDELPGTLTDTKLY